MKQTKQQIIDEQKKEIEALSGAVNSYKDIISTAKDFFREGKRYGLLGTFGEDRNKSLVELAVDFRNSREIEINRLTNAERFLMNENERLWDYIRSITDPKYIPNRQWLAKRPPEDRGESTPPNFPFSTNLR